MKKTLIISNVFWVLLFSALLFKNCTPDTPAEEFKDLYKSYEKSPFVGFPIETANRMTDIYRADKRVADMLETRAVWFSMDSLKKFIWHMEKATYELKDGDLSKLGVRLYLSRYPSAEEMKTMKGFEAIPDSMKKELAGKQSLYLVPTLNVKGVNKDYDPIRMLRLNRGGTAENSKIKYLVPPPAPFESAMNHATLCPVACSGTN